MAEQNQDSSPIASHSSGFSNTDEQVHPEKFCKICGGDNPHWTADNALFNKVNGSPYGIMCPNCFVKMAEQKDIDLIIMPRHPINK